MATETFEEQQDRLLKESGVDVSETTGIAIAIYFLIAFVTGVGTHLHWLLVWLKQVTQ